MSTYDELRKILDDGFAAYVTDKAINDRTALRLASLIRCRCIYRVREAHYEFNRQAIRASHRLDRVIA